MKDEHELPSSARRAFEEYPHLEPSAAFNRAVLDALASAKAARRRGLVGQIEEFLGVGLWSFAASGALGAFVPVTILGVLILSSANSPKSETSHPSLPPDLPFRLSPLRGPLYARELEDARNFAL